MSNRNVLVAGILTVMIGTWLSSSVISGQESGEAVNDYAPSQTPWGDPDLQGIWAAGYIFAPLERPDEFEGREFLTDEEVSTLTQRQESTFGIGAGAGAGNTTGRPERGTLADLRGAYNDVYTGRGTEVIETRRTSLIVEPPDGKIPYLPDVLERLEVENEARRVTDETADGPEDRGSDRCRGVILPVAYGQAAAAGGHARIVQTPDHVAIYYEHGHHGGAYRDVALDGRPHPPSHVRQWMGHAVGRWDGQTLIVETTNFTRETRYQGASENMKLVERFTPAGPDIIMYRATIEDPMVFSVPWTIEVPLNRNDNQANQIYEAACHEGNYALTSILAGARAAEQ